MLVVVCALALVGLRRFYGVPVKEQWRQVAAHVVAERREGDCVVVCSAGCLRPFNYYCREPQEALPRYPIDRHLAHDEVRARLMELLPGHRRVWLVLSHERNTPIRAVMREAPWAIARRPCPEAAKIQLFLYGLDFSGAAEPGKAASD